MLEGCLMMSAALGTACMMMGGVYGLARRWDNYGVVDVAWSWGFTLMILVFALMAEGTPGRKLLIALPVSAWSFRLGWYLCMRVKKEHPREDGRYVALRKEWGPDTGRRMFWFYQLQAGLLACLSLPFLLIMRNTAPGIAPIEWMGAGVILLSLLGESLADRQLKQFKAKPDNQGKVCSVGLWAYSRHPNYFFEWMVWIGFWIFCLGSPYGWTSLYCPLLMLWFLLKVTGIPATEEQALRSKGEAYARYQRTTSPFIPWFKSDHS